MKPKPMTLEQIRVKGLAALSRELGPAGLVRFLQQFETGHSDYTRNRHRLLKGYTVDKIMKELRFG
jgi:hypothetical protein